MAKIWSDIVVPVVVATAVLAQTVGVEASRSVRLHTWFPQVQPLTQLPDTLQKKDTLQRKDRPTQEEEEFDLFADVPQNTVPAVTARDTMKVPDSLRFTDPSSGPAWTPSSWPIPPCRPRSTGNASGTP